MLMQNQEVQRHATRTNRLESDFMAQAPRPGARLPLSADIHLNVLNNSDGRMCL